ncbi:hypothetical protein MJO28_010106 [Puccinia striiformis f. sp. tritici]|uniref:Uncharacterized protein n=1 Tax=Puccinia striiformis f. sp. tritici TaxID=168172 RepID=A0ACC0E438_9BASI|nr:hypothetical protein MJO28_010106 [Puccinia striiformis f. sp. tritici]
MAPPPREASGMSEVILLPNDPAFEKYMLPWSHLFEVARLYQACTPEERKEVVLARWVDIASKTFNPADLQDLLLPVNGKGDRVARIGPSLSGIFKRNEEEDHPSPALQKLVGCSINLDLPKGKGNTTFLPRLNPPELCKANQLNRTHGADRFINIKVLDQLSSRLRTRTTKKSAIQKSFTEFVHTPIRIGDKLFFFFLRKENFLWLASAPEPGYEATRKFINELLDLQSNKDMTVAKWAARTSLLLSATQASIDMDPRDVRRVPDVHSDSLVISSELLDSVANSLGLTYLPSCIEGLIKGKPFVWRLGVPSEDENHQIQLWDDQIGKASTHVFFRFRARRYDAKKKDFILTEEPVVIVLEKCLAMGPRPTGKSEIMTDGAGIISRAAAARVCEAFGRKFDTLPSAYQARIGFAKGLWILPPEFHPHDTIPWVEIRDSQWKAETAPGYTFHFNLCRISRSVSSGALGKQLLPILSARGVQSKTICAALEEQIQSTINDLNSNDPLRLTEILTRSPALCTTRRSILNRTANSLHDPCANRSFGNTDSESSENRAFTIDGLDTMSLVPFQSEEIIVSMLAAGFEPRNRYIVTKLRRIKEDKITSAIKFRVPIAQSTYVYVMPDPTGTLEEDEGFLQFSCFGDDSTGVKISTLTCPAIISRSPCVAPMDARKINLVDNEILRETYYDVLVCSIKGKTSLLSLLSGGDYDGDQVSVVWNPPIVQQFHNVNLETNRRMNIDDLFEPVQVGTVQEVLLDAYKDNAQEFVKIAQSIQVAGLFTPNDAGLYSIKHTTAEYLLGLEDPLTQKLGEVYVKCLDAPKAGTQLKPENCDLIKKQYGTALSKVTYPNGKNIVTLPTKIYPIPKYLSGEPKFSFNGSARYIQFKFGGKPHVLDELLKTGYALLKSYREELNERDIATHAQRCNSSRDKDLSSYFEDHKKHYEFNRDGEGNVDVWLGVLRPLQREISAIAGEWGKAISQAANAQVRDKIWESEYGPGTGGSAKTKLALDVQKRYAELTWEKAFEYVPEPEDLERYKINLDFYKSCTGAYLEGLGPKGYSLLKASCLSMCSKPESFCPYEIAFREICYLKAMASQAKKTNNSILNHFPSKAATDLMASRPPRTIVTRSYLTSVVKAGTILGRSKNQDQNLQPV